MKRRGPRLTTQLREIEEKLQAIARGEEVESFIPRKVTREVVTQEETRGQNGPRELLEEEWDLDTDEFSLHSLESPLMSEDDAWWDFRENYCLRPTGIRDEVQIR
jgi:hypothetical protein